MKRIALVDLGSNTARMVVYGYEPKRWFRLLDQIREPVRLGEGLAKTGGLTPEAFERGLAALRLFAGYAHATGLEPPQVYATSALRDAGNGALFLSRTLPLGLPIKVLSGEDEARFGVTAVANGFPFSDAWVMDLGGGSAQISRLKAGEFAEGQAYPLGAVRLTEGFLGSGVATREQVKALEEQVAKNLGKLAARIADDPAPLVAMGGTIRNLARAVQKQSAYPLDFLHGYILETEALEELTGRLIASTTEERAATPGVNPDRADIIVAGALVYRWLLRATGRKSLLISGYGVREGAFLTHFLKPPHRLQDVRSFSLGNLFARYEEHTAHVDHVRRLAGRLFELLEPLHRLGPEDGQILDAAALLHDIGGAISYYRHHKHGAYLMLSEALPGFDHREQVLILRLVRAHHSGTPSLGSFASICDPSDERRLLQLGACLRLAEYLERARAGRVKDLKIKIGSKKVVLTLVANEEPTVELWETRKQADLFHLAFGRPLVLESLVRS